MSLRYEMFNLQQSSMLKSSFFQNAVSLVVPEIVTAVYLSVLRSLVDIHWKIRFLASNFVQTVRGKSCIFSPSWAGTGHIKFEERSRGFACSQQTCDHVIIFFKPWSEINGLWSRPKKNPFSKDQKDVLPVGGLLWIVLAWIELIILFEVKKVEMKMCKWDKQGE